MKRNSTRLHQTEMQFAAKTMFKAVAVFISLVSDTGMIKQEWKCYSQRTTRLYRQPNWRLTKMNYLFKENFSNTQIRDLKHPRLLPPPCSSFGMRSWQTPQCSALQGGTDDKGRERAERGRRTRSGWGRRQREGKVLRYLETGAAAFYLRRAPAGSVCSHRGQTPHLCTSGYTRYMEAYYQSI